MFNYLKHLYLRIGIHAAPRGTLFYYIHTRILLFVYGQSSVKEKTKLVGLPDRRKDFVLAFRISGGIGDHLISARYIRDFLAVVGDVSFDVYSSRPSVTQWIFSSFPQFRKHYDERYIYQRRTLKHYPVSIWLMSFISLQGITASWKEIEKHNSKLAAVCQNFIEFNEKIEVLIDKHPRLDGYLAEFALLHGWKRTNFLQGASGISYGGDILKIQTAQNALGKFSLKNKTYITIHNGFDPEEGARFDSTRMSTKSYPHFASIVRLLHERFENLTIVQLGVETSILISGVDSNLIGQTNIQESAEILKHSLLHIDGESGLVHLAASLGVRSCVVFGSTSMDYFAYPHNINIAPEVCGNCWWMTDDWLSKCPRGFEEAKCLFETPPEKIVTAICPYLEEIAFSK